MEECVQGRDVTRSAAVNWMTSTYTFRHGGNQWCVRLHWWYPQWATADTEIRTPSAVESPAADKCFPFKSWSRSEYSHECFAHCQIFLPCPNFDLPRLLFSSESVSLLFNCVNLGDFGAKLKQFPAEVGHPAHRISQAISEVPYCALIYRWMVGF